MIRRLLDLLDRALSRHISRNIAGPRRKVSRYTGPTEQPDGFAELLRHVERGDR